MPARNRREKAKEGMMELILSAAVEIASKEGFDNISIRKIASKIEYSPSIIYHYFKDKDEIIFQLMQRGYQKIVKAVSSVNFDSSSPEERLKDMTMNYIEAALKMPDEFMAAQLNQSEIALKHTSSLFKGASREKSALQVLFQCVKEINNDKIIDDSIIELTSQMIAVSTLGLIIKLIIEKNIGEDQRNNLINFYLREKLIQLAKIN